MVNEWGRCHDVKNLFIVDGSVFVTGGGVNPTSTIQAAGALHRRPDEAAAGDAVRLTPGARQMKPDTGRQSEDAVKSLVKVVSILEAFSTSRRSMSLAEISAATGFPRSTTHRLAASLRDVGLLDQDGHRDRYRLGIRLFELGNTVLANMDLHREARPVVDALSQVSGHLVHLAAFDGQQAIAIHRVSADERNAADLDQGGAGPLPTSARRSSRFQSPAKIDAIIAGGLKRFADLTITDGRSSRAIETDPRPRLCRRRGRASTRIRCCRAAPTDRRAHRRRPECKPPGPPPAPRIRSAGLAKIVVHHASWSNHKTHRESRITDGFYLTG